MIDRKKVTLNTAEELFEKATLNFKNLSVGYADNINFKNYFDLIPENYLFFAKEDLKQRDERGLINALSNVKRAIDCLIENILKNFGINIKKIPKVALDFCKEVLNDDNNHINPSSLRLFCALGLAPSILVSEVRNLRNKVEHEFSNPKKEDVLRAYEVAELLINNLKAKELYSCAIDISDIQRNDGFSFDYVTGVRFNSTFGEFKESGNFFIYFHDSNSFYQYYLNQDDKVFYYFLRAMFIAEFDLEELELCIKKIISIVSPDLEFNEIDVCFRE